MLPSDEEVLAGRASAVRDLRRKAWCDVLVNGDSLSAAAFAHLAAFNGLRTVLVCPEDFYDPRFRDFPWPLHKRHLPLMARLIQHQELRSLTEAAPHLFHGQSLHQKLWRPWFGRVPRFVPALRPFRYHIEHLLGAKNEGAVCLNYTAMNGVLRGLAGKLSAGILIKQGDSSEALEIRPSVIVDFIETEREKGNSAATRYAMLIEERLHDASPDEIPASFIHIHLEPAVRGTLVICDSPEAGLSPQSLLQKLSAVNGLEPLGSAVCLQFDSLPLVSEPLHSYWGESVLRVRGGDLLDVNRDTAMLLEKVAAQSAREISIVSLRGRTLPGGAMYSDQRTAFEMLAEGKIPKLLVRDILMRLGGRVRHFIENPDSLEPVSHYSIRGELDLMRADEEVYGEQDLILRRLGARWV